MAGRAPILDASCGASRRTALGWVPVLGFAQTGMTAGNPSPYSSSSS